MAHHARTMHSNSELERVESDHSCIVSIGCFENFQIFCIYEKLRIFELFLYVLQNIIRFMNLDNKDRDILNALQKDGSLSNAALAKAVELSPSACLSRVRNLKHRGLIRGTHAHVDADQLGFKLNVFVHIKLENQTRETLSYLEGVVKMNPRVQECFRMTGEYDYTFRLLLRDTQDLEFFLTNELSRVTHIASIRTEVAMKCIKQRVEIRL